MSSTTSPGSVMCSKAPAARERRAFIYIILTKLVGSTCGCLAAKSVGNWPTISQVLGGGWINVHSRTAQNSGKSAKEQLSSTGSTEMKFAKQLKELKDFLKS